MHTSKPDKLYFPFLLHASAQNYVCHIDIGLCLCCIGSYLVFVSQWMTIVGYGVIQCDTEFGQCQDILIVPGIWVDVL